MKLSNDSIICLLFLLPFFTQFILYSAVCHIHDLGKSKTFQKKEKQTISLFKRIFLIGYVERCKYYVAQAKRLRTFYQIGIANQIICFLCWAFSLLFPVADTFLYFLVCARVLTFDIPVFLFFLLMTKHGKNGGVTWKWEV